MPAAPQETLQEDGAGSAAPQALSGGPGSEATRAATLVCSGRDLKKQPLLQFCRS